MSLAFASTLNAAALPGAQPKEWPANPDKHKVTIRREAADEKETAMIAAAEAAQPNKDLLEKSAVDADPAHGRGFVPTLKALGAGAGEKLWWYKSGLGIRIPFAITADAVTYYSDLVGQYGKKAIKSYGEPSSSLDYHASCKLHKEFKVEDKVFTDVYVVTLKLTFVQKFVATQTAAMNFNKERVVILDSAGKVLHISGDGPTEVPIMMM